MNKRILLGLTLLILSTGLTAQASVLLTLTPQGSVSGIPGATVGWGYRVHNDTSDWILISNSDFKPPPGLASASGDYFVDTQVKLAPGASHEEPFNAATKTGIRYVVIDALANPGDSATGNLFLAYESFSADPDVVDSVDCYLNSGTTNEVAASVTVTGTAVVSATNPSSYGDAVSFTASVKPSDATGAVNFKDGATSISGCSSIPLTNGSAVCTTTALLPGSHTITADYGGDSTYVPSTGTLTGGQAVGKGLPILSVTNTPVTYDGNDHTATVVCAGGGAASNILIGGAATQVTPGIYPVTADCADSSNYNSVTGAAAGAFVISPPSTVSVTIQTDPAGRTFTVNGDLTVWSAPHTFEWVPYSSHTITLPSPQNESAGTRYDFLSWSTGGAQNSTITAPPSGSDTYTASFSTKYKLSTSASNGAMAPAGESYYAPDTPVTVTVAPLFGYHVTGWTVNGVFTPSTAVSIPVIVSLPTTSVSATLEGGTPILSAALFAKPTSGGNSAVNWTYRLTNKGTGPAASARIDRLTVTQTLPATPQCTVTVGTLTTGKNIPAGGTGDFAVPVTFSGCTSSYRFTGVISYSDGGSAAGSLTLKNLSP